MTEQKPLDINIDMKLNNIIRYIQELSTIDQNYIEILLGEMVRMYKEKSFGDVVLRYKDGKIVYIDNDIKKRLFFGNGNGNAQVKFRDK